MLPHYLRKLTCLNLIHFLHQICIPIKGRYQTYGQNLITSQPTVKISQTVLWICSVSSWLRIRSLTRLTFSSVRHFMVCHYLWVCWLCWCQSLTFQQPVNATFCPPFVWNSFINSIALYPFNGYKFLIKILSLSLKPYLQTLQWRLQWRNFNTTVSRGNAATYFMCGGQCCILFCWKLKYFSAVTEF